ncbi:MAG: hypothetical protein QXI33_02145 [Candidatus Pacearchaeota archaeon]
MTSIIGVKTNYDGIEGIVMGSDTQALILKGEDVSSKSGTLTYKIIYGDGWMLGHAGNINTNLQHFNEALLSSRQKGKSIIEDAINHYLEHGKKYRLSGFLKSGIRVADFPLVNELNTLSYDEDNDCHIFILAAYYGNSSLGLWYVDRYGKLREPDKIDSFQYCCIGTGSDKINEYFSSDAFQDSFDFSNLRISDAISIVEQSLSYAEKDATTGPALTGDLLVLTKFGVEAHGKKIIESLFKKRLEEIERVKMIYNAKPFIEGEEFKLTQ